MAADWHAEAIRLSGEGRSSSEIAEIVGQARDTVKKYLGRIKKNPERALATVTAAGPAPAPAAVDLSPEQNDRVAEVFTKTQELQAEVDEAAYVAVRDALKLRHMDKLAFAKANLGVEYMKARKGLVSLTVNTQNNNNLNIGAPPPGGTLERLEALAAEYALAGAQLLSGGPEPGPDDRA